MWTSYQVLGKWLQLTEPFGKLTNMVIWSKGGGGLGDLKGAFATDYEIALVWKLERVNCKTKEQVVFGQ